MKIFHGSNMVVENPDIRIRGYEKDFGFGFYCTNIERQARRWAISKSGKHIVNVYEFSDYGDCKTKIFKESSEEWLDFVVACRRGIQHDYDIVEGPMADDQVWNFVEDVAVGRISRAAFWELIKYKHPTHQILFCTNKALSLINFISYYEL